MPEDDTIALTISLTARVPCADGGGGYDITNEDGKVTIKKYGVSNRTPTITLADLKSAIEKIDRA